MAEKRKEHKGLKKLRKETGDKPTFYCENCKRSRYSKCTCLKAVKKEG